MRESGCATYAEWAGSEAPAQILWPRRTHLLSEGRTRVARRGVLGLKPGLIGRMLRRQVQLAPQQHQPR